MRYPAAIPTLALAAGIAAGIFLLPERIPPAFIAGSFVAAWLLAAVLFVRRRPRAFFAAIAAGFAIAGLELGSRAHSAALNTPLVELFEAHVRSGEYQIFATVEGVLRSDAVASRASTGVDQESPPPASVTSEARSGVTLSLDVERLEIGGHTHMASGGALISVGGTLMTGRVAQWRAGRRVRLAATLRKPARYLDPGVPDAQRDLAWKGTSLVGSAKSDALVDVVAPGSAVSEALAAARAEVRADVAATVGPWSERSAGVVTAILIGDRTGLSDDMQRTLQEAGTYHVIAISGGNIAILAGLCALLLRLARCSGRISAAVIIGILVVYEAVVGGGSSVERATLMAAIYFAGRAGDQRGTPANVAAASAGVLFCKNPLDLVDASFALTFGATVGLLIGMPRLRRPPWMPGWLYAGVALLAASISAEIALLPISALVFSRVTAAGLLLNFAAIPLMTVVQIAGMAAVALVSLSTRAAFWAGCVAHLGVRGILLSASLVDVWPWMVRRVPAPPLSVVAAYYGALAIALVARRRTRRVLGFCVAAFCGWLVVAAPVLSVPFVSHPLRVTFIDVGQGDAAVIQCPDGRTLSVDAGGIAGSAFDIGSRVVSPSYWALGIRRLDYMSISHGDPDHIGGAASVFRDFDPSEVWEGVPVPPHEPSKILRGVADRRAAAWRTLQTGDRLSLGDVSIAVHHPPPPDWERQRVRNDDSEVLEITYGKVSFVFTGDIGGEVEQAIAPSFERAPIRILKVPHHGSASSSSMAFLRALRPDIAVISDGRGNPFGHPVPSVLDRYRAIGAAIYRTDLDGAVTVETDGTTVHVHTFTGRRLTLRAHGR